MAQTDVQRPGVAAEGRVPPYAYYALAVLTAASILNFVDRQILSILAQAVKADLKLTDTQLGFLLGTSFAVFYAVVGIAMGRISDAVSRTRLMGGGLALWSLMTVLGGASSNYGALAATRVGVGVGESTANPCSHSLLAQYFPASRRAWALGVYLSGAFIGGAAAMLVGGLTLQHWDEVCRNVPVAGACGVAGWKVALATVGAPGLLLSVLVATLREPSRPPASSPRTVPKLLVDEFGAAIPPFTLLTLHRLGGGRAVLRNLVLAAAIIAVAFLLTGLTGDPLQWGALALGAYSITTWGQVLKLRDRPLYKLTFGCPTFVLAMIGGALVACVIGAMSAWAAPYAMRELGMSPGSTGLSLGLISALSAAVAVIAGGWVTDRWKRRDLRAPIWIALIALLASALPMFIMLNTRDIPTYLGAFLAFSLFGSCWSGAIAALVQDLVLPRMRGAAASAFALVSIVIASGGGPYWAGKVSTMTGSLSTGVLSIQALTPIAVVVLLLAARRLKGETEGARRQRADAAGEAPAGLATA